MFLVTTLDSRNTKDTKTLAKLLKLEGTPDSPHIHTYPASRAPGQLHASSAAWVPAVTTGKTNLRLCDEDTLWTTLGVKKGSLSYLALMNDKV